MFGFGFDRMLDKLGAFDPDALQFITNWQIDTGATMPTTQRAAINDFYRGMKGFGTPNNSNLWTIAVTNQARIFPLIPLTDSTANALAYSLDAVSNGVFKGNYINTVAGDFTAQGVIGGVGKAFNTLTTQNFYSITNVATGAYCRTNQAVNNSYIFGASLNGTINEGFFCNPRTAADINSTRINDNLTANFVSSDSRGWIMIQRSGATREVYRENTLAFTDVRATVGQSTNNFYFHALNQGVILTTTRQLSMYVYGMPYLTLAQAQDFYTVIQRLQSNVITGGRQIGIAIPIIDSAPVNTVLPTISGTIVDGGTLTCSTGTWTFYATSISYSYQWRRNGVDVVGQTASTYTLSMADAESNITCVVTAQTSYGSSDVTTAAKFVSTPALILGANYYDHWDYTDAATLSVTGTDINSCTSKGTNGAVMASTGTERFKVLTNQINGFQVADADGINDFASVAASTGMYNFLHNAAGGTVIVIARVNDANPNSFQSFIANNGVLSTNIGYSFSYDDRAAVSVNDALRGIVTRGSSPTTSSNLSSNNACLPQQYNFLLNKVDGDVAAANRNIINVNGGANIANNSQTGVASGANATFNLNLGIGGGASTFFFKGQIAEVLIANVVITPQQETDLKNYYTFKYGMFPIL